MSLAELPASVSVIGAAREAVGAAYGQPLWQCTDNDLVEEISAALALRAQADAVLLVRLGEAEARNLSTRRGFRSLLAWLRAAHRLGPGEASVLARAAVGLRDRVKVTGAALACGEISLSQARTIDTAIEALAKDLPEAGLVEGEQLLLGQAASLDPVGLAGIGERLFAVLDPAGYQQAHDDKLDTAERGAYAERGFTLSPDTFGSGSLIRGSGWAGGDAIISAALDALAGPRPADQAGPDPRSAAARRYDALHELCRRSLHATPAGSGGRREGPTPGHRPAGSPRRQAGRSGHGPGHRAGPVPGPGPSVGLRRAADPDRVGQRGLVLVSPGGEAHSGLKMARGRLQTSLLLGPSEAVG